MTRNFCNHPEHRISRRKLLFGAAGTGAFLAMAPKGEAQTSLNVKPRGTAKTCIFITLNGAPSHVDTFDPKDGLWNASDVKLQQHGGGVVLSQTLFPSFSQLTSDLLMVRSVTSWELAHDRGQFYTQTAHPSNPAFIAESPHVGAVVSYELGKSGPLPPFLALNVDSQFQGAKFLGGFNEPLIAPVQAAGLSTLQHPYYGNNSQARFNQKYDMLRKLDAPLIASPYSDEMAAHATFYDSAKQLMYDPSVAGVFQFTADESGRYGDTAFGRACIVARNAVGQTRHLFRQHRLRRLGYPRRHVRSRLFAEHVHAVQHADRGVGNLISDLKASGDLSSPLIVMLGEFGRTPGALNPQGGRDHWKDAMSIVSGERRHQGTRPQGYLGDRRRNHRPGLGGNRGHLHRRHRLHHLLGPRHRWTPRITNTPSGASSNTSGSQARVYTSVDEVFG